MLQQLLVWIPALFVRPRVIVIASFSCLTKPSVYPRLQLFQIGCPVFRNRLLVAGASASFQPKLMWLSWVSRQWHHPLLLRISRPLWPSLAGGWGHNRRICSCHSHSYDVLGCSGARAHLRRRVREVQARCVRPFQTHHSRVVCFGSHLRRGKRPQPDALLRLRVPDFRHPLPPRPHPHPIVVPGTRRRRWHHRDSTTRWFLGACARRFLGSGGRRRVLRRSQHLRPSLVTHTCESLLRLLLRLFHHSRSEAPAILPYGSIHNPQASPPPHNKTVAILLAPSATDDVQSTRLSIVCLSVYLLQALSRPHSPSDSPPIQSTAASPVCSFWVFWVLLFAFRKWWRWCKRVCSYDRVCWFVTWDC